MRYRFFLLILLFSLAIRAQEKLSFTDAPLSEVLTKLEAVYEVKFSYNAAFVENKMVTLNVNQLVLSAILLQIENEFGVVFEQIDKRYYILKSNTQRTICGYIKDVIDNRFIEGATITNTNQTLGVVSDASGFFKLENITGSDTLHISFLGYRTIELSAIQKKEKKCNTYFMSPDSYLLNEVVVREYLAAGILKTRDGSIRINPNNLDILSGLSEPDILQNIQLLPGIESPQETASGLYIRGGSPDQNLILWDGIKLYNSDHFFGMLSALNPYITKDVKVSRSGTKAIYGDRVSGVIDIQTDATIPRETTGGFGLNLTHADAFLKIPIGDNFAVLLSGRRSITDILQTPTFNQFSDKVFQNSSITENQRVFEPEFSESTERFYFADVTVKAIAKLSKTDHLTVSGLFTKNRLSYSFQDIDFDIEASDRLRIQNQGANATWNKKWSKNFTSTTQVYYSEYDFDYEGSKNYFGTPDFVAKKNTIKETGASLGTVWNLNKLLTFSNGYQFFANQVTYNIVQNDFVDSDNSKSPTHALYSQLNYSKPESWYADIGLRASHYAGFNNVFLEPRMYIERMFGKNFRIKASAEIKNQAISQIIEFTTQDFGLENQIWALSQAEEIPLLRSDQLSAGFLFTKNGWNLDVDGYYKNIDGLTSLTRGFESAEDSFSEGASSTRGIDVLVKKKINNYSTWIGYTYSSTDFTFDGLNQGEAFRGNNDITHSLTWSHAYKWKSFQFSLGWKYRSGTPYSQATDFRIDEDDNAFINYNEINGETLPDYHRLDISALYSFKLSNKNKAPIGKIGFSLLNLYGRENQLSQTFSLFVTPDDTNTETIELGQIDRYSLGTTPNFVFRLNF